MVHLVTVVLTVLLLIVQAAYAEPALYSESQVRKLEREDIAMAHWFLPAGEGRYKLIGVAAARWSAPPDDVSARVILVRGTCKTVRSQLRCATTDVKKKLRDDQFAVDAATGAARLRFHHDGRLHKIVWTETEPTGGVYTVDCSGNGTSGLGWERHSSASGTLFGTRLETAGEHDWAAVFIGGASERC